MGVELEWKYRVRTEQLEAIQAAYPGPYRRIVMATTYYDTPERVLSHKMWTLRHRLENGNGVCTLKTPAPNGRYEYETSAPDLATGIGLLLQQGAPAELAALADRLSPRCGASFTRLALTVVREAFTAELALDQGVLLGDGKELPFAEAEVELKSGNPQAAQAFAQKLVADFSLEPEHLSKFARAAQLAGGL